MIKYRGSDRVAPIRADILGCSQLKSVAGRGSS